MKKIIGAVIVGGLSVAGTTQGLAQEAAPPPADTLPDVEVQQQQPPAAQPQPQPKPAAAKPKPKPKPQQQAAPAPASVPAPQPPEDDFEPAAEIMEPAQILANSPYGSSASVGAAQRAQTGNISPVDGRMMIPGDLQNYAGAGTRVSSENLDTFRPITNQEALARIPGVVAVNDDGLGRHSGISIRGSAYRRSRKVLIMEDGVPINFATYLDSSNHYTPPLERIESIEVLRGNVVAYGPLNNFGVVNFRNLSPFGDDETVIKFGLGTTEGSDKSVNNFRHVHTRQTFANWGVVASYSGGDSGGAWDNEELGYNDFYGAIGVKDDKQDLTVSAGYFRQRDTYDEDNFEGTFAQLSANGRDKNAGAAAGFFAAPFGYDFSNYNADFYRVQVAHNYYFDANTTLSTRAFYNDHHRARFYPVDGLTVPTLEMEGRDRHYQTYGVDSRIEFANNQLFSGMTYDIIAGVKYEEQLFTNMNRESRDPGDLLTLNNAGELRRKEELEGQSFAAFVEAAVHVTPTFTVTPGIRIEDYDISYVRFFNSGAFTGLPLNTSDHTHVLPSIAFAWEAMRDTTIYGGYFRGLTPHIVRDAREAGNAVAFPLKEEIGDNFQIGVRSKALTGLSFDMAYFHSRIENYQFGESFTAPVGGGDRAFASLDEVDINGFEIGALLQSRPFHGGPWNFFAEATYTFADVEIAEGFNEAGDSVAGNRAPESIRNSAMLTLGVQFAEKWDASISANYRGDYFRDEDNSADNFIPDQWLMSARTNYKVTDAVTLWAVGQNLTDEFYLNEIADGLKLGQGRTIMGGFTLKFD